MNPISSRNTFVAVVDSIRADLAEFESLPDADVIPVASGILADADRVVATIESDEVPDWADRECKHLGWNELVDALDKLRDDYTGRSAAAISAAARAEQRRTERLISHRARTMRANASLARRQAERAAVLADPNISNRAGLKAAAPAPAKVASGPAKAKRSPKVVR